MCREIDSRVFGTQTADVSEGRQTDGGESWVFFTSPTPGYSNVVDCPTVLAGDVDQNGALTAADIIYLVNHVFKGGPSPNPCAANGDVNCSGGNTAADVIFLVQHVFKGGPLPCDICALMPGTWTCP